MVMYSKTASAGGPSMGSSGVDYAAGAVEEAEDQPEGVNIADSRYGPGRWETLTISDHGVTMVGCSPEPSKETADVQGGAFLMTRCERRGFHMTAGGGA